MAEDLTRKRTELLVIGGSAGSLEVILKAFANFREALTYAIIIVLHRKQTPDNTLVELLASRIDVPVIDANEKDEILPGHIYVAPADYHLLIESDRTISLDYSEKINFSRPCIDVTFQTAAEVYRGSAACLLLSGANADGVEGLELVEATGGITAVQDPDTAEVSYMPQKALEKVRADFIVKADAVAGFMEKLSRG